MKNKEAATPIQTDDDVVLSVIDSIRKQCQELYYTDDEKRQWRRKIKALESLRDQLSAAIKERDAAIEREKRKDEALERYADEHNGWVYSDPLNDEHRVHGLDCLKNKFVDANSSTGQHGYTLAVQALTDSKEKS